MFKLKRAGAKLFYQRWFWLIAGLLLSGLYLGTRLTALTKIPVFADEAIYIYWAQLASDDWGRFAFYPLNDGKTPLFIWSLLPLVKFSADPLGWGRFLSVMFGWGQLGLTIALAAQFTKRRSLQFLAGWLVIFAPGFFFNQRLALMDTMLTFLLTGCFLVALIASRKIVAAGKIKKISLATWGLVLGAGLLLGASLLTKLSALLMLPVLLTLPLYFWSSSPKIVWRRFYLSPLFLVLAANVIIILGGLTGLAALRLTPNFSALLSRSGNFLHSGASFWEQSLTIIRTNGVVFIQVLSNYFSGVLVLLTVVLALGQWRRSRTPLLLLGSGLLLAVPIVFLGAVVYPRYFLPVLPFLVVSLVVSLDLLDRLWLLLGSALVAGVLGSYFFYLAWTAPAHLPLTATDRMQFFTEWSAGYGIRETVAWLKQYSLSVPTLVLTEGHVGTLPDGLQIYFFADPARSNLRIEGIGPAVDQAHLEETKVVELMSEYSQVVAVVNSHRVDLTAYPEARLLEEFARPDPEAPTLQVWWLK